VLKKTKVWIAVVAVAVVILGGIGIDVFAVANSQDADATVVKSDPQANVPVSVTLSADGRRLALEIDWDDELHKAEGTDRFTARVMAGTQEIEQQQWTESRPDVHAFEMAFDEAEATRLLTAAQTGDAVVAITQQSDADGDALHETNHATVLTIPAPKPDAARAGSPLPPTMTVVLVGTYRTAASTTPPTTDCSQRNIGLGADLSGCDLHGANLAGANLSNATLTGANLTGANLNGAVMEVADLTDANLTGANLTGADLTGANLTRANLTDANLTRAVLVFANLSGANLTGANLTGAVRDDDEGGLTLDLPNPDLSGVST
jgi:uncharacterized protein YjbI with pentapeptide repeats